MWEKGNFKKLDHLGVPFYMIERASHGLNSNWQGISQLFDQRCIPEKGWKDLQIQNLLQFLSGLDSDKDQDAIRIGEREARVSTPYLSELSGGFCHGVGRSGNLTAAQPKAAGTSLMQNLTNKIALSLIKTIGIPNVKSAIIIPMGTGMTLGLTLRGLLNHFNINIHSQHKVLMTQVDHKSPIKGIKYVGGDPQIIPGHYGSNYYSNEGVYTSIDDLERIYNDNKEEICAIISNSAFFAPRVPDNLKEIAKFAQKYNIIHIINNSYGLQSDRIIRLIRQSIDAGRVDAIVQSTDKCFLTPVGGAIILSPDEKIIQTISESYAGRASSSPCVQLLTSLLSMGKEGYINKMNQQQKARELLQIEMEKLAFNLGEKIIQSDNPVSIAMTLTSLTQNQVENLGGYLYNLRVTGPRIINPINSEFGCCTTKEEIPFPYIVMNASIGVEPNHIYLAVVMLQKAMDQVKLLK